MGFSVHFLVPYVDVTFLFISEEAEELPNQLAEKASITPNNLVPAVSLSSPEKAASSTQPKYRSVWFAADKLLTS